MNTIDLIRKQIFFDFGYLLPISGGLGNSIDNPIVINREWSEFGKDSFIMYPVQAEHLYLKCVLTARGLNYNFVKQSFIIEREKKIDKLEYEVNGVEGGISFKRVEAFYFDI